MKQPTPFEITDVAMHGRNVRIASNGLMHIQSWEPDARVFRRRGISGMAMRPAGEVLVPKLNELAGELLQKPDTPAHEVAARLMALAGLLPQNEPQRHEWLVVQVGDVRVYCSEAGVIVSREDLHP